LLIFPIIFLNNALSIQEQSSLLNEDSQNILNDLISINQKNILKNLQEFAIKYESSPNAIQKFLLRKKRKQFINKHLKDGLFNGWVGRIKKLQTTENGEASLEIELSGLTEIKSRGNNSYSKFKLTVGTFKGPHEDLEYKTLIYPETPLYNWLANFQEGEWIVFSGNGFFGDKDYLKVFGSDEYQAMMRPKFIVKFEFFEKINILESEMKISGKTSISKNGKQQKNADNNFFNTKIINIRYYQNYRLSNYNWNYEIFINRWNRRVRYHWNNHPPSDYLEGSKPRGGEVFVLVTVQRDGQIKNFKVNSLGEVSENMKTSALEAVRVVSLPPIPEDFPDEELKIEFRFEHSRISHLIKKDPKQINPKDKITDNLNDNGGKLLNTMSDKINEKQILSIARASYNEEIKQELSSHFKPIQRFAPDLKLEIKLALNNSGKIIEKEIISRIKSEKFKLAIMNSLIKARFNSIPKSLFSETPYRIMLRITP